MKQIISLILALTLLCAVSLAFAESMGGRGGQGGMRGGAGGVTDKSSDAELH